MQPIPWDRIVHWYGRATAIPETVRLLRSADPSVRRKAQADLTNWLEHQGGLSQATPFTIQLLVQALDDSGLPDREAVIAIIEQIAKSALFQMDGPSHFPVGPTPDDLIAPELLWPEFISEEEDEMLWEELGDCEEWKLFQAATAQVLIDEKPFFQKLAEGNHGNVDSAKRLLAIACAIETSCKIRAANKG
jgi:hypothetical protein